jgi:hypothetical protein
MTANEKSSDCLKVLCEWALAAGRFFQSAQTGYVHLYYGETEQNAQTIPLLENTLFSLALLRSRLMEQIQEAKGLLKKLLAFQNLLASDDEGNFPVYLHEYPFCQDPALGLQLLAPFYWILKQFGHILGVELKQQLENASRLVLEHSLRAHQRKPFPYSFAIRLAAAQLAYGKLWANSDWQQIGQEQLEQLAIHQLEGWQTTRHLADILVGLQMVYPSLSQSIWSSFWQHIRQTWHPQLACYVGPCVREWQEREEPQINLYDLFGGFLTGQFSRRATLLSPHHLHGILIQAGADPFALENSSFIMQGELKQQAWRTICYPDWAYTLLEKKEPYPPAIDKTHTPFRWIWGDLHRLHSLVCQGGNIEKVIYREEETTLILLFDLRDHLFEEESQPKHEIEFFVDFHPDIHFHLNGYSANTFELGQTIQILFGKYELSCVFNLIQGTGDFLGHIMRGNRPSQVKQKAENRFQAYDWTFFLRTIRRQSHCKFQVKLTFSLLKDFNS